MIQKDKDLLLKDLCARLPYGVVIHHDDYFDKSYPRPNIVLTINALSQYEKELERWNVKPYLRPISNITNKELAELCELLLDGKNTSVSSMSIYNDEIHCLVTSDIVGIEGRHRTCFSYDISLINLSLPVIDFFNAHHFDYRGLIEKDLALVAPEGMYKFD